METTDILICGCGPTGGMLAALLGRMNINCIVLDKDSEIASDPRGIVLDEDGIRILQSIGVYDNLYSEIGSCMGNFNFVGGTKKVLDQKPFMVMDYSTSEGGTGHVGFICHKQPILERSIRDIIQSLPTIDLRIKSEVVRVYEDSDFAYVEYRDETDRMHTVRAKFLVGADGRTGFIRKNYLEPRGVLLEKSTAKYDETWVALNWKITLPTPQSHPNFPLWALGYTPEDVYLKFFPVNFRFLCNPTRPAVCGRFGLPNDRLWRFEFVVAHGEDPNEMAKEESIKKIVFPYITHPGSWYGLQDEIAFPDDCIKVLRCRPFAFSARSCNKWSLGRVVLCGDAAHVFPPFGGQGIASGFRDSSALAWRLAMVCRPNFTDYPDFLTAWARERKQQLDRSLRATVENGNFVVEANHLKIFARNFYLGLIQMVPSWKHWLEMGARRYGMTRYVFEPGMGFLPKYAGGVFLPQVYCFPLDNRDSIPAVTFTDDVIFESTKESWFQLIVLCKSSDYENEWQDLQDVDAISNSNLRAEEATFIVHDCKAAAINSGASRAAGQRIMRIATAKEFAASPLCLGRPAPKYYNEHRIQQELPGKKYVIVRPDRLVFAACATKEELDNAAAELGKMLAGN
ncbi:FAD/NAD(P)-binding domain-containing protein [Limtongia smithiae]|uniref:FAD/NAD(P)-binding domain-containing protein n=1 Tax=Limtongia smithiae TaxID=1125753 RepID=UPI0034CFF0E0